MATTPTLAEEVRVALLKESMRLETMVHEGAPLPRQVHDLLARIQTMLRKLRPDPARLALLGHALLAWHLDQGFAGVPLHVDLAQFALRLSELEPRPRQQ